MQLTQVTLTALITVGQLGPAIGGDAESGRRSEAIASSAGTELRLNDEGDAASLELCSGGSCSVFTCPGYDAEEGEASQYSLGTGMPWPRQPDVALIEYFQTGSGAIPSLRRVTVSSGHATCDAVALPAPSMKLPDDEEQFWGTYVLDRAGLLDYDAGGYKKGRTDACHACRADTVLHCSWVVGERGFLPRGCELSNPTK